MVGRLNQGRLKAEDIAAATQFFTDVWIPRGREQEGFRTAILLTRPDGNSYAIDVYDTEDQLLATEATGWYQQTTDMFADRIKGRVRRNLYTVTMPDSPPPAGNR